MEEIFIASRAFDLADLEYLGEQNLLRTWKGKLKETLRIRECVWWPKGTEVIMTQLSEPWYNGRVEGRYRLARTADPHHAGQLWGPCCT
jgi:hypothetical protein